VRALRARVAVERPGAVSFAATVAVHLLVAATLLLAGGQRVAAPLLPAYRVELVAAPRAAPAESPEPVRAPAPPETPQPAPQAAPAPSRPAPPPEPAIRTAPRDPVREPAREVRREPAAAAAPAPAAPAQPGAGGPGAEVATIRTEGVDFPFPGYLRNLVGQVYRRWRAPDDPSTLEAEIFFFVHRDGSISGLRFSRRSGSFGFDLEAQGAVEAAARAGAFGPLPSEYGADVLPVSFFFSPRAAR
jgi:outer membrane biosynthesis protein TonB